MKGERLHSWTPFGWISVLVLGVGMISATRLGLVRAHAGAKERYDIYSLPSPQQLVRLSFGYRSALADLLFAHVLVESGIHLQERRRFQTVGAYLKAINALDPRFATPYYFADTLITLQAGAPSLKDYRDARAILERGLRELPHDSQLWLTAGQFLAYLAPPHVERLSDAEEGKRWRLAGARILAHSCELIGSNEALPYHCVTAARLLGEAGERQAVIQFVERVLAISDDPEIHRQALASLTRVVGAEQREQIAERSRRLDQLKASDLPSLDKDTYLALGPPWDPVSCLDRAARNDPRCATSFRDYHERLDHQGSMPRRERKASVR